MSLEDDLKSLGEKYGIVLRPDSGHGTFHRRIVNVVPIPNTKTGNFTTLECGHICQTFGSLAHANGKVHCDRCAAEGN